MNSATSQAPSPSLSMLNAAALPADGVPSHTGACGVPHCSSTNKACAAHDMAATNHTACAMAGSDLDTCAYSSLLTESVIGRLWPVGLLLAVMWLISFWVLGWL